MKAFIPVLLALGIVAVAVSSNAETVAYEQDPYPQSSILFLADTGGHEEAYSEISESLAMLDWDATIVATPATANVSSFASLAAVSEHHYVLQDRTKDVESVELDGLTLVVLDRLQSDPEGCRFSDSAIRDLVGIAKRAGGPLVVVSDLAFWRGVEPLNGEQDLALDPALLINCGGEDSVIELFRQLPDDGNILFLSRGGNGVYDLPLDNYRFIQLGTPDPVASAALTFLRVGISHGELAVGDMYQSNPSLIDTSSLDQLPTYSVTVDPAALRELYNTSPFYDRHDDWWGLLEDRDFTLPTVAGTIEFEGTSSPASIRTRGSFGNHWSDIKKSWTIDIPEPGINGTTQLKLILPSDRLYINQLFVQEVNRSEVVDVLSPTQSVARLSINGRDFGAYLMYEDFDKAFVEKHGFNSDAQRAGLFYRDFFGLYDIWDDQNFITTSSNKQDRTRFLPALRVKDGYEEFIQFFEPANYRPWIASQLFTGDPHQNAQNNTRFFVDLATGRYIMLSWDQFFTPIKAVDDIENFNPTSYLQFEILEHEEGEVLAIVEELLDEGPAFAEALRQLQTTYIPVFTNDPYMVHPEAQIEGFAMVLDSHLVNNIDLLTAYVSSR